jgi:hypothetical protein
VSLSPPVERVERVEALEAVVVVVVIPEAVEAVEALEAVSFGSLLILWTLQADFCEQTAVMVATEQTRGQEPTEVEAVEEAEAVEDVFTYSAE